jgi:lantibiotic modifying enzyme
MTMLAATHNSTTNRQRRAAEQAARLVEMLLDTDQRDGRWMGTDVVGAHENRAVHDWVDLGPCVYSGSAGIAWALTAARRTGALSGSVQQAAAESARRSIHTALDEVPGLIANHQTGLIDGAMGIIVVAHTIAEFEYDDALRARYLNLLQPTLPAPVSNDYIDGLAGTLVGLMRLEQDLPWLDSTIDRLLAEFVRRARRSDGLAFWPSASNHLGWCGLAHGSAGAALALAVAHERRADELVGQLANETIAYERAWFRADLGGWPDLREGTSPGSGTWCNGAAGIGLGRLRSGKRDAETRADLWAAMAKIVTESGYLVSDLSICHGLAGSIEFLIDLDATFADPVVHRSFERTAELLIDVVSAASGFPPTGLSGPGDTPSLFVGAAGTVMTLLRLASPGTIPSVACFGAA